MSRRKTNQQFIQEVKEIFGNKYDCSHVEYINAFKKVMFVCNEHGVFWQRPNDILNGHGCPKCGRGKASDKQKIGFDIFVSLAKKLHPTFEYDEKSYISMGKKVRIKCPIHGWFEQLASDHLRGHSCPECSYERNKTNLGCGAYNDTVGESKSNGKSNYFYRLWINLLTRVENAKYSEKYPSYKNVRVCDDWLLFSNFLSWCKNPENGYRKGYELDKDILSDKDNKIYSPETCCFVPHKINTLFRKLKNHNGLPIGVQKRGEKYMACFRFNGNEFSKTFNSIVEAEQFYKEKRKICLEHYVNELHGKGEITDKVYHAIVNQLIKK